MYPKKSNKKSNNLIMMWKFQAVNNTNGLNLFKGFSVKIVIF